MRFRPCIDIHNGKVKQIVGSTLRDGSDSARENFISGHDAGYYAGIYKSRSLSGGHVIVLNGRDSGYYEASKNAAFSALSAFPGGMQYGGGINNENAREYLDAGASHVIATSFIFKDGILNEENLFLLQREVGKERLVLDLSCRKKEDGCYYVTTDRWQKFTDFRVTERSLRELSNECDEFLIHAVDVEGKGQGTDSALLAILGGSGCSCTYAGGVHDLSDISLIREKGQGRVDFTVGSALDLFGGSLSLDDITAETY